MKYIFKILLLITFSASLYAFERYSIPCQKYLLNASLDTAMKQIGTLETGNNLGKVLKYTDYINLPKGSPYCAAGVYYCFDKAAKSKNDVPIPKTGVATRIFNFAKRNGTLTANIPQKHDLIIWRFANSWRGHIERIYDIEPKGWVNTIAFNTKKGNKEGVFKKRRNLYHILGRLKVLGLVGFSTEVEND